MGERVEARAGRDGAACQPCSRVADHDLRHHRGWKITFLGVGGLLCDDARAADLRACPGSRRHGDDRQDAVGIGAGPPVADILEIPHGAGLPRHEGDHLAGIERGAAAEGDDAVVLTGLQGLEAPVDVGLDRIRLDVREDRRLESGAGELVERRLCHVRLRGQGGSVTISGAAMPTLQQASASSEMRPAPKRTAVG